VLLIVGFVQTAYASPLFELLGGSGGQGGLQARHAGPSAASAYFNPSLLTDAAAGLTFGVVLLNTEIGIQVDPRSPEAKVPEGLVNAGHADGTRFTTYPIATDLLQNGRPETALTPGLRSRPRQHAGTGHATHTYESIGLVIKLFKQRLALGFHGLIPNNGFTAFSSIYADEREQYFTNSLHAELYGDRTKAMSLAFAAGVRITDSLTIGAGATIGLLALADAPVYVADAGRLQDIQLNTDVDAKISLIPHGGISWRPHESWHLTGTVHAPQKIEIEASFQFLLATGIEQGSSLRFTYDYQPWQVGGGLGYDVYQQRDLSVTATASLLYARWSRYIDRQAMRPAGTYAWQDTFAGAGGVRMQKAGLAVALDGQYKPTPVPQQTGRTNYVDNDRVGVALAIEQAFTLWETSFKVGVQVTSHRLLERHQTKIRPPTRPDGTSGSPELVLDEVPDDSVISDMPVAGREGLQTNNPGWPGFSSGGWVTAAGLTLSVAL